MKIRTLLTAVAMTREKLAAAVMLLLCPFLDRRMARPNPASA